MKKLFALALIAASVTGAYAKKDVNAGEEVLLTIDKRPTTLSEFKYLFNKNNSQQAAKQTPEEYLDLFTIYKLKVADAIDNRLDTTDAFRKEFEGYRRELAAPYLMDKEKYEALIRKAYGEFTEERKVSHIMFPLTNTPDEEKAVLAKIDSVRRVILAGEATFDEMAVKHSIDVNARRSGSGDMGYISAANGLPYQFVDAAFDTPVGEISEPVNSGFGWHIVLVKDKRPASGEVLAEHILKLTQGKTPEQAAAAKAQIDSLYTLLTSDKNADFNAIAQKESEDPGSASKGGRLDWFGRGRMVPQFEQVAFDLAEGEISKPFPTSYGYHIIHKLGHRPVGTIEELRPTIEGQISSDERGSNLRNEKMNQLKKQFAMQLNTQTEKSLRAELEANGGYDSVMKARFRADRRHIVDFNTGDFITVSEIMPYVDQLKDVKANIFMLQLMANAESMANAKLIDLESIRLSSENPDYRNLLNEYHDGILLYEISNRNVWEKASQDREGLEKFFLTNRQKYSNWTAPRFKGYIVFATSDSIAQASKEILERDNVEPDSTVKVLRKHFGNEIRVERVIAEKGKNEIVDNIAFGGNRPEIKGRWIAYFPYRSKLIEQPEEASDVRGDVTSDYQTYLEQQWIKELKKKHKIKVNTKALRNL